MIVQIVLDRFAGLAGGELWCVVVYEAKACGCQIAEFGGTNRSGLAVGGEVVVGAWSYCVVSLACRCAMLVKQVCWCCPVLGRLMLPVGAPMGWMWRCMCSNVLCCICCRCLCTSGGVLCW